MGNIIPTDPLRPVITHSYTTYRYTSNTKICYQIDIGVFGGVPYQKETILYSKPLNT